MKKAKKKLQKLDCLKVVGITGSYGKTTTKKILKTILEDKYETIATSGNRNSAVGVALSVLDEVKNNTGVFIAEMGAYKKGEIKDICQLTPPDVAVITAVSSQHLALFGDIQNTLEAKYEIVENAKPNATVVLNTDSDMISRIAGKSKKREIFYSTKKQVDLWASDIKSASKGVEFDIHYKGQTEKVRADIIGEYNVSNILAATAVAISLGMNLGEITKILTKKKLNLGRLSLKRSRLGFKILDDSYNSNPEGFSAALALLENMKGNRKILVTIGIIELGDDIEKTYNKLSKKICEVCDVVVTTDRRLATFVQKECSDTKVVFDEGTTKQLKFLKTKVSTNDVVLLEGPNNKIKNEIL